MELLIKLKESEFPEHFVINGQHINDKHIIANAFNTYYTGLGPNLASKILPMPGQHVTDYLENPVESNFTFTTITVEDVSKIIDGLKSKPSSIVDNISVYII